jgi:hypothetical protein
MRMDLRDNMDIVGDDDKVVDKVVDNHKYGLELKQLGL